jgi:hypothetical protein
VAENNKESIKGLYSKRERTLFAEGDKDMPPEVVLEKYRQLIEEGRQDISLEDLIADYYGGKENLDVEIGKAREAYEKRNVKSPVEGNVRMSYDRIREKIPVRAGKYPASYYTPEDKEVTIQDPATMLSGKGDIVSHFLGDDSAEGKKKFEDFLKENRYTKEDYIEMLKNPLTSFKDALEHEVGHHPTSEGKGGYLGLGGTHMATKVELANQLGRIQREAYNLYGERFTPETLENFMKLQDSVPEKERFKQFSPDTRRGLRELYDAYKGENFILKDKDRIWPTAKESIPFFVEKGKTRTKKTA